MIQPCSEAISRHVAGYIPVLADELACVCYPSGVKIGVISTNKPFDNFFGYSYSAVFH